MSFSATKPMRIAVAVSGGGRTLANLLEAQAKAKNWQVVCVIASRADCKGASIAQSADLPLYIDPFKRADLDRTQHEVPAFLAEHQVDLVALAGFLRPYPMTAAWAGRVVNIHPALLPKHGGRGMYGDHVHTAVLAAGDKESGATLHYVTDEYDEGAVIAQTHVPVKADDTTATLAARVFASECELYPRVLSELAEAGL